MSHLFYGCESLASLDVSHFDTSKTTRLNQMFSGCASLTSLDVSHFNTSNVADMSYMFAGCESLTSLDVSKFNTSKVTDMSYMFADCSSLTSLNLGSFDTTNVTTMLGMFALSPKLVTTITIRGTNCTTYKKTSSYNYGMSEDTATDNGAKITVNYTADASELVDKMIATKSSNSNVVKGTQIA